MNFDGTTDDALGQRVVVFKTVHRVLRVLCVSVSSVFKQTRRLRSCMTSSRAVGRCVRHRGHRDTEDTEEFRDFASTTLPTTDGRICCLAITAGAPRSARGLFVYTLSVSSVSLCPLCLNKNPSTTFLHDIVARCWTLCSTQRTQRNFVISHQRLYRPRTVEFAVLRLRRVHLFVYTLSEAVRLSPPDRRLASERADCAAQFHRCFASSAQPISTTPLLSTT